MNIRVLRKAFQAYCRVITLSRTNRDREHILVLPRLSALLRWRFTTVTRVLDLRKVSNSSELKSLLLSMCIEAPESTTNVRSSGAPTHKELEFFCQDSLLGCTSFVHQSVLSLLVQKRMFVAYPFFQAHGFPWQVLSEIQLYFHLFLS